MLTEKESLVYLGDGGRRTELTSDNVSIVDKTSITGRSPRGQIVIPQILQDYGKSPGQEATQIFHGVGAIRTSDKSQRRGRL